MTPAAAAGPLAGAVSSSVDRALAELSAISGLTATTSDVLDELGYSLAVAASAIAPRTNTRAVVGRVTTLRYLPHRRTVAIARDGESGLAHELALEAACSGDVLVVDATGAPGISVLGGLGASAAVDAGIAALLVDGGIRDLDQIAATGLSTWARVTTPVTGKWRLGAATVNEPVACGGVQVRPGDLAIADETGVCFVPAEIAAEATARILDIARTESSTLKKNGAAS